VTPDSIPIVDADPDVAVREAKRIRARRSRRELDLVQTRRGISQAKSNNRFNAPIVASAGFNQTTRVRRRGT
jgi:hypothetical protein